MDLPLNIVIGNVISLIAGVFIILSMWVNDEKQAYKYQFLNAFILMISSVFFFSWTGVTTMAIAASRNAMVYKDKLTFNWTVFFIVISVVLGLLVNTLGFIWSQVAQLSTYGRNFPTSLMQVLKSLKDEMIKAWKLMKKKRMN